ncbi:hypothetical protein C0991_002992 [Blastosporella zonata]|nr:hypothetical protein C0991_002992 [Blastosporella zonata]
MSDSRLIVYRPFGIPTDQGVFDDVKTYSLWPVTQILPKILQVIVYTAKVIPGVNGVNGIEVTYEVNIGGKPVVVLHGEKFGEAHVIDTVSHSITNVTATVSKDAHKPSLFALTLFLSDGSKHGPYPPVALPDTTEVSAPGITVGFFGSLQKGAPIGPLTHALLLT